MTSQSLDITMQHATMLYWPFLYYVPCHFVIHYFNVTHCEYFVRLSPLPYKPTVSFPARPRVWITAMYSAHVQCMYSAFSPKSTKTEDHMPWRQVSQISQYKVFWKRFTKCEISDVISWDKQGFFKSMN